MLCSDKGCPCPGQTPLDPRTTGYLYISDEVVDMRRDALSWEQLTAKVEGLRTRLEATVFLIAEP